MSLAQRLMASSAAAAFALVSIVHPALGADNNGVAAKPAGNGTNVTEVAPTPNVFDKSPKKSPIAVVDFRDETWQTALNLAARASYKKNVTILLVKGDDRMIRAAATAVRSVYETGRKNVGLVISSGEGPALEIFGAGARRQRMVDPDHTDASIRSAIEGMIEVYEKYTVPALNSANTGNAAPTPPQQ